MKRSRILAVLLAAMMLLSLLTGCAAGYAKTESADYARNDAYYAKEAASAPQAVYDAKAEYGYEPEMSMTEEALSMTTGSGEKLDFADSVADFTEKIIYSADVTIQTTEFDSSVASLESAVAAIGGFIESSSVYGDTRYRSDGTTQVVNRNAYYTVRVPAGKFEEFLHQAGALGNVLSTNRWSENVTSMYTDYEARLSSLYTQEERLLEMLKKSDDVQSLIELESRLSEVRYEIESIERNLRNLDMKISYSTVTLSLREVEVYTPTVPVKRTFGEKLSDALSDGWRSFADFWEDLTLGLAEALPGLIIFAVIVVVIVLVIRRSIKKHKAKKAAKAAQAPQNPQE